MTKPRSHTLDIYDVHLHLATSRKQWATLRREHDQLDKLGRVNGTTSLFGDSTDAHLAIYINGALEPGPLVQIIGHEATHGAGLIMDEIRATYDGLNEPMAWLVGWLVRWMWEQIQ